MMMATMATLMDNLFGNGTLVPLLILSAVAILLLRRSTQLRQRQMRRNGTPAVSAKVSESDLSDERVQLRRNMESLLVELQELSRKISAEIDTRYAKLEVAIQDADRRIAALNRLCRSATEKSDKTPGPGDHAVRHAIIYELADAGFTPVEIAKDLGKTTGEVELILNLRRSIASPTPPVSPPSVSKEA